MHFVNTYELFFILAPKLNLLWTTKGSCYPACNVVKDEHVQERKRQVDI